MDNHYENERSGPKTFVQSMAGSVSNPASVLNGDSEEQGVLGDYVAAIGPLAAARAAVAAACTTMEAVGEQRGREVTPPKRIRSKSGDRGRE